LILGFINPKRRRRRFAPPLPPDGGGFFYLKRKSDGALLCDGRGGYVEFLTDAAAASYASERALDPVDIRWMPKLITN
jgi:hypothetical protein